MPIPPTNTSPAAAYDITGLLPFSDTINLTALANPQKVWFKFTLSGQYAISIWMQTETSKFTSRIKCYFGLPLDPATDILQQGTSGNTTEFFIEESVGVPKVGTIYISIENQYTAPGSPTATPTIPLTVKFEVIPNITIPIGSVFISNDIAGYPASIIKPDGTVAQIRSFVPNGESAAILENGISLWAENPEYSKLMVYDVNFELIASTTWPVRNSLRAPISSNRTDTFYVADDDKITTVTSAGALGTTVWTVPTASPIYHIAPSLLDNDIIYVKTWDGIHKFHKSTQILDAAFIPYDLGVHPARWAMYGFYGEEFIVMPDDTIVTLYSANGTNTDHRGKIIYYSPTGSVISETMLDYEDVNRISYGSGVSVTTRSLVRTVWTWTYDTTFKSVFIHFDMSGTVTRTEEFTRNTTSSGVFFTEEDVPDGLFGIPESCPLTTTTVTLPPYGEEVVIPPEPVIDVSGIYFINPVKATHHDSYYGDVEKKIPNPTIKTALIGE